MRSPRLLAAFSLCAALLAACGNQQPATQTPDAPTVGVDASNATSLSITVVPKSADTTLLYSVNGGAQQTWKGSSTTNPVIASACPGANTLVYTVKYKDQTLLDNQTLIFQDDPEGAFTIGGQQTVQVSGGQSLALSLPLNLRSNFSCSAVASVKLDGNPITATVSQNTVTIASNPLAEGTHSLSVAVSIGQASQQVTIPVVVGTSTGGTSSGGTSSGGTSSGGTSSGGTSSGGTSTTPAGTVTAVDLQPSQLSLTVGGTGQLTGTVTGTGQFDNSVVYSSSAKNVATVDGQGVVTAVTAGQATITATSAQDASKTATAVVTVSAATQGKFTMNLSPSSLRIAPGSSDTSGMGISTSGGYSGLVNLTVGAAPSGSGLTLRTDRTSINANVSGVLTVYVASSAPNGSYTIPVTASDGKQSSTANLTVTVAASTAPSDTQKPVISSVSLNGQTLTSSPANVNVSASDNVSVSSVTLSVDGALTKSLSASGGSYVGSLDLSNLQNGSHSYIVTATDPSGNSASSSGTFTVQISGRGPSISKAINIGNSAPGTGALLLSDGTALIGSGRTVLRINPDSGTSISSNALDGQVVAILPVGNTLYAATAGNSVWTMDLGSLGGASKIATGLGTPSNFSQSGMGLFLGTSSGVYQISGASASKISSIEATSLVAGDRLLYVASRANGQIVEMTASGVTQGQPISVRANWITMNTSGTALNVAPASSPWSLSALDLGNWTLSSKMSLKASAIGLAQYGGLYAVDNVGYLTSPDGTSQQVERGTGVSYASAVSGNSLYIGTDSGTLYVYSLDGRSATYLNKTANLGKLGAPLAVDSRGRIYYPNAAGTLYILQPGN